MHFSTKILDNLLKTNGFTIIHQSGCGFLIPLIKLPLIGIDRIAGEATTKKILAGLDICAGKIPEIASSIIVVAQVTM